MSQIAKEKAQKIVDAMVEKDGLDVSAMMQRKIEQRIYMAIKEQDRDTRHACADAVLSCENKTEAHSVCMNVQAL